MATQTLTILWVKRFIDRQRGRRAKSGVAIRLCRGDAAMRQITGRAGAIDYGLAELGLQLLKPASAL